MEDNTLFKCAQQHRTRDRRLTGSGSRYRTAAFPVTRTSRLATLCSTATRLDTENRQLFAEDLLGAFPSMHRLD